MLRVFIHLLLFISFSASASLQVKEAFTTSSEMAEHSHEVEHDDHAEKEGECHDDGCDQATCCVSLFGCASAIYQAYSHTIKDLSKIYKSDISSGASFYRPPPIDQSPKPPRFS